MMLKTSSNKVNPFSNMFRFSFRRNLGIIVLVVIGFLLICPAFTIITLNNVSATASARKVFFSDYNSGFSFFCAVFSGIAVVLINLLNFSYMFKRNASDFTDSLPITRTELFISKVASGYLLVLIPSLLSLTALGITATCFGFGGIFKDVLINILYIAVITALCSAISMIFIVSSAGIFDFLASFAIVNVGLVILALIFANMFEELLIGFYGNSSYAGIIKTMSPVVFTYYGFGEYVFDEDVNRICISYFIKNAVMILVFFGFSLILYKKRKTESTGKAFAYKFIYIICAFLISFCASYAFGAIFADGVNFKSFVFYIFALIGALIAGVAYGAITFRGFKTVKRSLIIGCVSFALMVASAGFIRADFVGFNKRIPENSRIKTATLEYDDNKVTYTDPTFVTNLHKKIITEDGVLIKNDTDYNEDTNFITIEYKLKNGRQAKRFYIVNYPKLKKELSDILKSKELFDGIRKPLIASKSKTVNIYSTSNDDTYYDAYLTVAETLKFLDIYEKEIKPKEIKPSTDKNAGYYNISFGEKTYYHYGLYFDETFTETKNYLDSLNLGDRVKYSDLADDIEYAD